MLRPRVQEDCQKEEMAGGAVKRKGSSCTGRRGWIGKVNLEFVASDN